MKKPRSWKFSHGGGALFFLLLVGPLVAGLLKYWPGFNAARPWVWLIFLPLIVLFAGLLWYISLRPLIRQSLWKLPRTWYEGCFGIAVLYFFYAVFVFVTGYTPSKYNSHAVPRSAGVLYLYWAAAPLVIGSAFYFYDKRVAKVDRSEKS